MLPERRRDEVGPASGLSVLFEHARSDEGAKVAGCLVVGQVLVALIDGAADPAAGGSEIQGADHPLGHSVASDPGIEQFPEARGLIEALSDQLGLLVVGAQAESDPLAGVVVGLPGSAADLTECVVVGVGVPTAGLLRSGVTAGHGGYEVV